MPVRLIPEQMFRLCPRRSDFEALSASRGYTVSPADGSGGSILSHPERMIVWKVADDPSTRQFAEMLRIAPVGLALPRAFAVSDASAAYVVIGMERLFEFSQKAAWAKWVEEEYRPSRGSPPSDPFGAVPTLQWLRTEIIARGGELDIQAKNILLRRRTAQVVLFDPVY